jgi:hypothetical protein
MLPKPAGNGQRRAVIRHKPADDKNTGRGTFCAAGGNKGRGIIGMAVDNHSKILFKHLIFNII